MSPTKKSLAWSAVWSAAALACFCVLFYWRGSEPANQFLAGYLVELSLSLDNVFVFAVIFDYFAVETGLQRRVLFWGVIGSAVLRGLFIIVGVRAIARFHWILVAFGLLLVVTAVKLLSSRRSGWVDRPEANPGVRLVRRFMALAEPDSKGAFFRRKNGKWVATRLLLVLVVVEVTDLVFAFDSLPAVLAFTRSTSIAFASNLFAVVGLRSLYFALSGARRKFRYLEKGLAVVLLFIGAKILAAPWYAVTTGLSLGIVGAILAVAVFASAFFPGKPGAEM